MDKNGAKKSRVEQTADAASNSNVDVRNENARTPDNFSIRADSQNVNREITADDVMERLDGEEDLAEQSLRWMLLDGETSHDRKKRKK